MYWLWLIAGLCILVGVLIFSAKERSALQEKARVHCALHSDRAACEASVLANECPSPNCVSGCSDIPGKCCKLPGTNVVAGGDTNPTVCDDEYYCYLSPSARDTAYCYTATGASCSPGTAGCVCYTKTCSPIQLGCEQYTNRCAACGTQGCTACYPPFVLDRQNAGGPAACVLPKDPLFWTGGDVGQPNKLGSSCACSDSSQDCSPNAYNPNCGCVPGISNQYVLLSPAGGGNFSFCAADSQTDYGELVAHLGDVGAITPTTCGGQQCSTAGLPAGKSPSTWFAGVPLTSAIVGIPSPSGNVSVNAMGFLMPPDDSPVMKHPDHSPVTAFNYVDAVNANAETNHALCNNGRTRSPTVDVPTGRYTSLCDYSLSRAAGGCPAQPRACQTGNPN